MMKTNIPKGLARNQRRVVYPEVQLIVRKKQSSDTVEAKESKPKKKTRIKRSTMPVVDEKTAKRMGVANLLAMSSSPKKVIVEG